MSEPILKLDGKVMPSPKLEGVSFSEEKIWSKNTGRTVNGSMVGDIIAVKKTVSIEFPPLSPAQVDTVEAVVSNKAKPFFSLYFSDGVREINKTVYAGPSSGTLYSAADGIRLYKDYKIDLIEQ